MKMRRRNHPILTFCQTCLRVASALFLIGWLLAASSALCAPAQTASESGAAGTWRGTLGSGAQQLHIVLTVVKLGNGEYSGQLNSVDQGAMLPMDLVAVQGTKVRFEIKAIGGVYEGTLNDARMEINGTWTQASAPPQPLAFQRDNSAAQPQQAAAGARPPETGFAGSWDGVAKPGEKLQYALTIVKLSNGEYAGTVTRPSTGMVQSLNSVVVEGDSIRINVNASGSKYEGKLSGDHNTIEGILTEADSPGQPLSFKRSAKSATTDSGQPRGPTTKPFIVPLDVLVPAPPRAFHADGKTHLVYELHVVNMGPWDCELTRVEVLLADSAARSLDSATGAKLEGMMARPGVTVAEKSRLAPGTEGIVYVWVSLDRPGDVPAEVRHRISAKIGEYPEELSLDTGPVAVSTALAAISSPLRGDKWLAGNGPSNTSGHRRALIPIDGRAAIAQRFAIDWVKLGDDGKTYHDDKLDNKNYYAYGNDALAVANGVVTEVKDGIPQNVPGIESRAVPITLETVGGNHVIVDIGNGNFAFYAHLQPGSIRVKLGDKVRTGQVLGLVGNSGNSTEPHLHFHISNGNSPLGSEGLPYALPSFEVQGHGWTWKPSNGDTVVKRTAELPLENDVVRFASQP